MSTFGISDFEIIGYCTGNEIVCVDCAGVDERHLINYTPIFAGGDDASDECSNCGENLMESYTGVREYPGPSETDLEREADAFGEAEDLAKAEKEKEEEVERWKEIRFLEAEIEKLKKGGKG